MQMNLYTPCGGDPVTCHATRRDARILATAWGNFWSGESWRLEFPAHGIDVTIVKRGDIKQAMQLLPEQEES